MPLSPCIVANERYGPWLIVNKKYFGLQKSLFTKKMNSSAWNQFYSKWITVTFSYRSRSGFTIFIAVFLTFICYSLYREIRRVNIVLTSLSATYTCKHENWLDLSYMYIFSFYRLFPVTQQGRIYITLCSHTCWRGTERAQSCTEGCSRCI